MEPVEEAPVDASLLAADAEQLEEGQLSPSDPRLRQLNDLGAGNAAILKSFERDGVQIPSETFLAIRLNNLARFLLSPSELLDLDLACQQTIRVQLEDAERQIRMARLTQAQPAVAVPSDLLTAR